MSAFRSPSRSRTVGFASRYSASTRCGQDHLSGELPFREDGAQELLQRALDVGQLHATTDPISSARVRPSSL